MALNVLLSLLVVLQITASIMLGVLLYRNGRNGVPATFQVASESSRIVELVGSNVAPSKDIQLYRGIPFDEHLLELDKRALDESYHAHLIKLWSVWLSDGARSSANITNGLRIAREAYHQAAQQIQKREQQIKQEGH